MEIQQFRMQKVKIHIIIFLYSSDFSWAAFCNWVLKIGTLLKHTRNTFKTRNSKADGGDVFHSLSAI